jgi:hypothetical protein
MINDQLQPIPINHQPNHQQKILLYILAIDSLRPNQIATY